MSTDYRLEQKVRFDDLFDGRLEEVGIYEHTREDTTSANRRCLTDGNNFLWIFGDEFVTSLTRYMPNGAPGKILSAIAEFFDTDIFSEYQPQYWGFGTQEEWDEAMKKLHEESEAEFYQEIMKYVRGEENNIRAGTNGMNMANIAKALLSENPSLNSPDRSDELMKVIHSEYENKHVTTIKLEDKDIALAKMLLTHEADLPFV